MTSKENSEKPRKTRDEILKRLKLELPETNLYSLAAKYEIPIEIDGKKNKGWVGQTIEKAAGLSISSAQLTDGIDCELKTTSLVLKKNRWFPKETIKVTQLNPKQILSESFEESILWRKLSRLVFVGVHHVSPTECYAVQLGALDLSDPDLVDPIRAFWEDVQSNILTGDMVHFFNLGNSQELIQLRPVGDGKQWSTCPITGEKFPARAFYATKILIEKMLQRNVWEPMVG
ncbi:MAG: MutH/Sau3AI family endonuclease [Deltaproteobacteria bacterium]|jgi:DNA mismatch repair protein MutH